MLSWNPEYALGIAEIDSEHQQLVDMMRKLELAADRRDRSHVVKGVIAEIGQYVDVHFRHEEELMEKAKYPAYEQHYQAHKAFARKVEDLKLFSSLDPAELHKILVQWLIEHIMKADRDYAPYVEQYLREQEAAVN